MKITINNNGLVFDGTRDRMVSGSVGTTTCTFALGDKHDLWDGLVITAVWRNGSSILEQAVSDGATVTVPHEVLAEPGELYVGIYGMKEDGPIVRPELWCDVGQVLSGVPIGGQKAQDPTLDAYQDVYLKVRDVADHELTREQAEESRIAAEKARAEAETARVDAETKRLDAETARQTAETERISAETSRVTAETARADAEAKRASAETERETQQAKNNADQAANNKAARGITYKVLGEGEYAANTEGTHNVPTIDSEPGVIYFTPRLGSDEANNLYDQWGSVNGGWELLGKDSHISPITTDEVDSIVGGTDATTTHYLDSAGLSYWRHKRDEGLAAKYATKDTATTSSAGLMSAADKTKLDDKVGNCPVYYYATKPDESAVPKKPSLVVCGDGSVYLVS